MIDFVWLIYRICETSPELKKHKFFLFEVNNFLIKLHGAWIFKNLGTFIFENSWTMIFWNSWSMNFKTLMKYVFQLIYICDKKAGEKKHTVEKTFIILIQSILFSNGGLLHREKKFLFREILIIFFLVGVFFKFHWSMPQWILFFLLRG